MQRTVHMLAMVGMSALTLTLGQLAGCASAGQDENYKMLEEDRPMFETRPDLDKPGASLHESRSQSLVLTAPEREDNRAGQADADENDGQVDMTPPANPPANDGPQPLTQPAQGVDAPSTLQQPRSTQNDATDYDPTTAQATQEAIRYSGMEPSVTGLDRSQWKHMTVGPNLNSAYRDSYFGNVDPARDTTRDMVLEPVAFGWDIIMLPVRMTMTPPWKRNAAEDDNAVGEVHIKADEWKHDPRNHPSNAPSKHDTRKKDAKAVCETCSSHAGKAVMKGSACCTSDDSSCCVKDAACCM